MSYARTKDKATRCWSSSGRISYRRSSLLPVWISYEILQKQDDPAHLVIVKAWESVEAHQATAGSIPPDMLAKARELLAEPPSAGYYHLVEAKQA